MRFSALTPTFADIKTWVRSAALTVNQLITGKQDKSDNLTSIAGLDLTGNSGEVIAVKATEDGFELAAVSGGSGIADGDYGDITVSGSGTVLSIDAGVVSTTELGGDITTAGKALLDDATAGDQLTTLGLSSNGKSLVTAADYAAMKALLDLEIGTDVQAYDADLGALAGVSSNGLLARTGAGTAAARTITAGTGISVTNGDGVAGNPTIARASGTSFPGSPSTGDIFWRSDRLIEYVYDGTRWLSTQQFTRDFLDYGSTSQTATFDVSCVPPFVQKGYSIYVETLQAMIRLTNATTSANYFTAQVMSHDNAGGTTAYGSGVSSQNATTNAFATYSEAVNAVIPATEELAFVRFTETGTATARCSATFTYRLVG